MDTKAIAIAAVLFVAVAAVTVCLPWQAEATDPEAPYGTVGGGVLPVAYAEADLGEIDDITGAGEDGVIRAILYVDTTENTGKSKNTLLIDLNDVPVTKQIQNLYKITLTPGTSTAPAELENVAAVNGLIYLDVSGTDKTGTTPIKLAADGQKLTITISSQDADTEKLTGTWVPKDSSSKLATVSMTPTSVTKAMTITLYNGSDAETATSAFELPEEVHKLTQATDAGTDFGNLDKAKNQPLMQNRFANMAFTTAQGATDDSGNNALIDPNGVYTLIGWTVDSNQRTGLDLDLEKHSVEEIIYAYADGMGLTSQKYKNATETEEAEGVTGAGLGTNGTVSALTFVGVYQQNPYQIKILDVSDTTNSDSGTFKAAEQTAVKIKVSNTEVASATVNAEVDEGGYALLRIQHTAASSDSYTYQLKQYTPESVGADKKITYNNAVALKVGTNPRAVSGDDQTNRCTVTMLANGIYKISDVNESLNLEIVMTKIDSSESDRTTSYNLAVDYVKNYTSSAATKGNTQQGVAAVSLDLYDTAAFDSKNEGTLKLDGTYYRVDSDNIRVYGQVSTMYAKTTPVAYVDNVQDNRFINATTPATAPNTEITDYTGSMEMKITLTKANAQAGSFEKVNDVISGSAYDLVLKLPTNSSNATEQYYFYAAQGIWTIPGTDPVETPWALAEVASS